MYLFLQYHPIEHFLCSESVQNSALCIEHCVSCDQCLSADFLYSTMCTIAAEAKST